VGRSHAGVEDRHGKRRHRRPPQPPHRRRTSSYLSPHEEEDGRQRPMGATVCARDSRPSDSGGARRRALSESVASRCYWPAGPRLYIDPPYRSVGENSARRY
jgi:hypothetical protein